MEVTRFMQKRLSIAPAVFNRLRTDVVDKVDVHRALTMDRDELLGMVAQTIDETVSRERLMLNSVEQRLLAEEIVNDMVGLGPIQAAMDDPSVTDVLVNGPDQVLVERGGKLALSSIRFRDADHVMNLAQRITAAVGRRIDESSPMVDARLPDGSRVNIVAPPLSLNGVCISIRKFSHDTLSLDTLAENGALSETMAAFIKIAARARLNILVSGGTGSGKTTLLNAVSQHIARDERIITIEDAAELKLDQPFVVRLETRPASLEGSGEVTQRDLLKNALRMRPDRILLGEVRGAEAIDMLQAMNTGHDGSLSTLHANSPKDALLRLENLLSIESPNTPSALIRRQLAGALDLLIQVERDRHGTRRLTQIADIAEEADGSVSVRPLFNFEHDISGKGGRFVRTAHQPTFDEKLKIAGLYDAAAEVLSS